MPDALDGTVYPVLQLDDPQDPARIFPRAERRFSAWVSQTGAASKPAASLSLTNPGVLAIVEFVQIYNLVALSNYNVYVGNAPSSGTTLTQVGSLDTRQGTIGAAAIWGGSNAGVLPAINAQMLRGVPVGSTWELPCPIILAPPIAPLTASTLLIVAGADTTANLIVNIVWRERPVTLAEMTV